MLIVIKLLSYWLSGFKFGEVILVSYPLSFSGTTFISKPASNRSDRVIGFPGTIYAPLGTCNGGQQYTNWGKWEDIINGATKTRVGLG